MRILVEKFGWFILGLLVYGFLKPIFIATAKTISYVLFLLIVWFKTSREKPRRVVRLLPRVFFDNFVDFLKKGHFEARGDSGYWKNIFDFKVWGKRG